MDKDFDRWNKAKKRINGSVAWKAFYEREVWWCVMGVNIGVEIDGKSELFLRPVIVLRKFNKDMALVLPTTTQDKNNKYYLEVSEATGKRYKACLSQVRTVSSARLFKKMGTISHSSYRDLVTGVADMIKGGLKNDNTSR